MRLHYLELTNFKNHSSIRLNFLKKFAAITGLNGSGKTNILDSIFYTCFTKSYFNSTEIDNVKHGEDFFRIDSTWIKDSQEIPLDISYQIQLKKKKIRFDGVTYKKLSDHIGVIPVVMVAPEDQVLLLQLSEERRKFLDITISQADHEYVSHLSKYNRILRQRNALLKEFHESGRFETGLLEAYDEKLCTSGIYIHGKRNDFSHLLNTKVSQFYEKISGSAEHARLEYVSQLQKKPMEDLLKERRDIDLFAQRTTCGTHKDDIEFKLNDRSIKKFGSQGQQKSFILSLKIAQMEILYEQIKDKPIIIIDDIFAKLDDERVHRLLSVLYSDHIAQVFISDTNKNRIETLFKTNPDEFEIIQLDN